MNQHTVTVSFGIPQQIFLLLVILLGWHIVFQLYARAGKIEGF